MNTIDVNDVKSFIWEAEADNNLIKNGTILDGVTTKIEEGQFIGIIGPNGSGKTSLSRHLNALLVPDEGSIIVYGLDTRDEDKHFDIHRNVGMVFQNPDNQLVTTQVEDEVGFGLENLGVPTEEIWIRVEETLRDIGMLEYRYHSPYKLSGGQKQKIAMASILAMKPKCIVLDEPTAMLDPKSRKEIIKLVREINKKEKISIILITHNLEEVVDADKILVMDKGKIIEEGTPSEILSNRDMLEELGINEPQWTNVCQNLIKDRVNIEEAKASENNKDELIISAKDLNYAYEEGSGACVNALKNVSLDIYKGEFIGLIGQVGSGKSTLLQHLNGLKRADSGKLYYREQNLYEKKKNLNILINHVGLVLQYPEAQLFETTVIDDVAYGPKNKGLSKEEARQVAIKALEDVGLGEKYFEKSPFDLSGGEKRRVAIAGVLAMNPEVFILDEPTAGLDSASRKLILDMLKRLNREKNITIILVSHNMDDIVNYADRVVVLNKGEKLYDGTCAEVFSHYEELERIGLL